MSSFNILILAVLLSESKHKIETKILRRQLSLVFLLVVSYLRIMPWEVCINHFFISKSICVGGVAVSKTLKTFNVPIFQANHLESIKSSALLLSI